jgi:hypothetical protein
MNLASFAVTKTLCPPIPASQSASIGEMLRLRSAQVLRIQRPFASFAVSISALRSTAHLSALPSYVLPFLRSVTLPPSRRLVLSGFGRAYGVTSVFFVVEKCRRSSFFFPQVIAPAGRPSHWKEAASEISFALLFPVATRVRMLRSGDGRRAREEENSRILSRRGSLRGGSRPIQEETTDGKVPDFRIQCRRLGAGADRRLHGSRGCVSGAAGDADELDHDPNDLRNGEERLSGGVGGGRRRAEQYGRHRAITRTEAQVVQWQMTDLGEERGVVPRSVISFTRTKEYNDGS